MIRKSTIISQIKGEFVRSQPKCKIYITISIRVMFSYLIFTHNIFKKLHRLFLHSWLISAFTSVFLLLSLFMTNLYLLILMFRRSFSFRQWKQLFIQVCPIKQICKTNSMASGNETMLMLIKCRTGDSAEMDENYISIVRGLIAWNSETYFIKTLPGDSIFGRS